MSSFLGFARSNYPPSVIAPMATVPRGGTMGPLVGRQPFQDLRLNDMNLANNQHPQQQTTAKKRRSTSKRKRTNKEWRKDLLEIYSVLFAGRKDNLSLRSYCMRNENMAPQYARIAAIWKELGMNDFMKGGTHPTEPSLVEKINGRFPVVEPEDTDMNEQEGSASNSQLDNDETNPPEGAETTASRNTRIRSTSKNETRTHEQWKDLIQNIYLFLSSSRTCNAKETVRSYCVKVLKSISLYRRIQDVWKELELEQDLKSNIPLSDPRIKDKLERRFPVLTEPEKERRRDLRPSSNSYFDDAEEAMLCECVASFARAGFPLEKANLKAFADAFLEADGIEDGRNSSGGISMDTVERIYKQGRLQAKTNVNPIDPKRAAQADAQVLNAFYHQLEASVKIAHEINPEVWPEDRYANVPPSRIYNTDEQGPNPTHLRNPVLVPMDMIQDRSRLFQNTREGDGKMSFHYSVANVVRTDGVQYHPDQSVEGAPAPYILISDASSTVDLDSMDKADRDKRLANQSEEDTIQLNEAVLEGWFDNFQVGKKDDIVNPFGFQIRTTPTGSMLKRTFYDFILHFAKQLPHDQGEGGIGVYLFLDWHCSRECPQSLITAFFKYNIMIVVLPAKTSIWAQPCDNGKNELTARDIAMAAHDLGLLAGRSLDYLDANQIFRRGLETNCTEQNDELRRTGTNAVVSSFKKTGLYPMNYDNEGWKTALVNFDKLNKLIKEQKLAAGEVLPDIIWIARAKDIDDREVLVDEDVSALKEFLPCDDFLVSQTDGDNATTKDFEMPLLFLAMAVAEHLLGSYVLDPERDVSLPPVAKEPHEIAALKLVEFVAVTADNRVDTRCTLSGEAIARDKLRTKLALIRFGHSIMLRKKESDNSTGDSSSILNLMKQSPATFIVLDGKRRQSQNMVRMSVKQILDTCYDANDDDAYTLTKKDKRKGQKRGRVARKKLNCSMIEVAKEIADANRIKRNVGNITSKLLGKRPQFASRLAVLLEEEEVEIEDLYADFEEVVLEPYSEVVPVTLGDTLKEFSVTRVGTDVSAVSNKMQGTLMKLMLEMKARNGEKTKRKRRRGHGQSTHLGKSGLTVGILIQRQHKEKELSDTLKEEQAIVDEVAKLDALLCSVEKLKQEVPDGYWKWNVVKGKKRTTLAKLFGVYKSSSKAEEEASKLRGLNLTRAAVEDKIKEMKESLASKQVSIEPILARRREHEDFLESTAGYAAEEAVNDESNVNAGEELASDDDD